MVPSRRSTLDQWHGFVRRESHVLRRHPAFLFQLAANQPEPTAPAGAARRHDGRGRAPRAWLRWINKPADASPCLLTLESRALVDLCRISPDGRRLLAPRDDRTLQLWSAEDGQPLATLAGHTAAIMRVVFSPDGSTIATTADDVRIGVWNAATGERLAMLAGHGDFIRGLEFSADGRRLVSASEYLDPVIRIWDVDTGRVLRTLGPHDGGIKGCALSSDDRLVVSISDDSLKVWDIEAGTELRTIGFSGSYWAHCAFVAGGTTLLTVTDRARLWRIAPGGVGRLWGRPRLRVRRVASIGGATPGRVGFLGQSPDGHRLAATTGASLDVYDAATGRRTLQIAGAPGVERCAWSQDATRLLAWSKEGWLRVWDAGSGRLLADLAGHAGAIAAGAFSPDAARIYSGSDDQTIRVWDAATGACVAVLDGHTAAPESLTPGPDGTRLLSRSMNEAKLWDTTVAGASTRRPRHTAAITAAAFAPTGDRLLTLSSDGSLLAWDTATGAPGAAAPEGAALRSHQQARFSGDAARVVLAHGDETLSAWDAGAARLLRIAPCRAPVGPRGSEHGWITLHDLAAGGAMVAASFWVPHESTRLALWDGSGDVWLADRSAGHQVVLHNARFSPDGRLLACINYNARLELWSVPDRRLIASWQAHDAPAWLCGFSDDGATLMTVSRDAAIRFWIVAERRLRQVVHAGRPLDWGAFLPGTGLAVACGPRGGLTVRDVASGDERAHLAPDRGVVTHPMEGRLGPCLSPDGRALALRLDDGRVEVWTLPDGRREAAFDPQDEVTVMAWRDRDLLALGCRSGAIHLLEVRRRALA